ncbi:MAG: MBL fold metallo-hydrolase, partial [Deltaproteobacteria bacterium]|nr:MBL fold metallo-hydrolase [Deltaproteobacteria bacterium]
MRRQGAIFVFLLISIIHTAFLPRVSAGGAAVKELAPGVWAFIGENGAANSGFIVTDEGVVVIDSQGPQGLALQLREKIREATSRPVIYVINTHYHGDHTFGNQFFPEARAIIAHEKTRAALIERDNEHRERFKRFFGPESLEGFTLTPPTVTFTERLTLHAGGRTIELVYAGSAAHTPGDIFVLLPAEKVVFAGDLLYNGRLPLLNDGNTPGAIAALDRLSKTGALIFVPGHGGITGADGVAAYRGYLVDLTAEVRRLKGEGKSVEEVKKEIELPRYSDYISYREWLP